MSLFTLLQVRICRKCKQRYDAGLDKPICPKCRKYEIPKNYSRRFR